MFLERLSDKPDFSPVLSTRLPGAILLLLPATLACSWRRLDAFSTASDRMLLIITEIAGLACLYWSGIERWLAPELLLRLMRYCVVPFPRDNSNWHLSPNPDSGVRRVLWKLLRCLSEASSVGHVFDTAQAAVQTHEANPILASWSRELLLRGLNGGLP